MSKYVVAQTSAEARALYELLPGVEVYLLAKPAPDVPVEATDAEVVAMLDAHVGELDGDRGAVIDAWEALTTALPRGRKPSRRPTRG